MRTDPDRPALARALLLGLGLLALSSLGARAITHLVVSRVEPTRDVTVALARLRALVAHQDDIVSRAPPVALFIGSSLTQNGVAPLLVDEGLRAHGRDGVTSFNLGVPDMAPGIERLLVERLQHAYERRGARPWVAVLELTPFLATERLHGRSDELDLKRAVAADDRSLARLIVTDPPDGLHLAALRAFDAEPPWVAATLVRERLLGPPPATLAEPIADAEAERLLSRIGEKVFADVGHPREKWDLDARGGPYPRLTTVAAPELAALARFKTQERMRAWLDWRQDGFDILGVHLDESALRDLESAARTLKTLTPNPFILVYPRNLAWVRLDDAAKARIAAAIDRVARASGVPVIDLSEDPRFVDEDFSDTDHLDVLTGQPKLSAILAEQLAARATAP